MTTLLYPASGKYLLEAAPEHLHQEATEWLSELEFYKTEIAFLIKILDIAFLRVTSSQNLNDLKVLEQKISSFREHTLDELNTKVIGHENHLSELDEDVFKKNKQKIDEEHHQLFQKIKSFIENVRELKKEIFNLVEIQLKRAKKVAKDLEEGNIVL